ncbi:twin-arginine translocation signal domain-containing protein, partial [Roseateles sp. GG27B]
MSNETEQFRRDFLKKSAGMAAMAMGAAPLLGSQQAWAAAALDKQALRTIGLSVTVQERILADFKKASGVGTTLG